MRKLLATTALALLLTTPTLVALHAQNNGGSSSGGASDNSGGSGGSGATSSGGTGGASDNSGGGAGGSSAGGGQSNSSGGGETGGTTGLLTTTPGAKSDDAAGTRGVAVGTGASSTPSVAGASWGDTTGADLVGQTVYGSNGEEIGEIQDIVTRQGTQSPEALVGVGGFLGIGERNVAIPLSQIRQDGDRLTTTHTKESLGAMQAYNQSGYSAWDRSQRVGTGSGQ
jgi:sporulation protein YlmC with PRC-barrel domain